METRIIAAIAIAGAFGVAACDDGGGAAGDTHQAADSTATGPPAADTTAAPVDTTSAPGDVKRNPLGAKISLELEPFTVQSGRERQVCKTINLPIDAPMQVVRIHARMQGVSHHFNLYKVIDDSRLQPVTEHQATVHTCAPADEQLDGDAAYIFGSADAERIMDTPEGIAFSLEPGQRLILEQHVINFTDEPMEGGVTLDLYDAGADATIAHEADVAWLGNWGFILPPNAEVSDKASCTMPYDVAVFGMMSHFHELGILFEVDILRADGTKERVYTDDDWAHPLYKEWSEPLIVLEGEKIEWTCTWNNTRSEIVFPNKDSTDEMCILFMVAYPHSSLSEAPIMCNVYL